MESATILSEYFSDFTAGQIEKFSALENLYTEWNARINVISRKDIEGLYEKHVLHSLAIAATFNFPDGFHILDVGTGGGFPGIPLAIYFPSVKFHLVDSINKKLNVVRAVAEALDLQNITVQHSRAEDITDKKFDFVVSRAVAPLGDLWRWTKKLLKDSSFEQNDVRYRSGLICLKGGDLAQEISDSGLKPRMLPINSIFDRPYFQEKFILYVPR